MGDSGREILVVNQRTGSFTAFRPRGVYQPYRQGALKFLPDRLAHLLELGTGLDYLMAAPAGSEPRLFQWSEGGNLAESSEVLPAEPSLTIGSDAMPDDLFGGLQVYQIGAFASVVLTNSQGQTFNVANLRVTPQMFLVFGNLERRGTLDVGVAFLLPSRN
jgi:hypothetical protein